MSDVFEIRLDGSKIAAAEELLQEFPNEAKKAFIAAQKRTVQNFKTNYSREIREEYAIKKKDLDDATRVSYKTVYDPVHGASTIINFRGHRIPLARYVGAIPKGPNPDPSKRNLVFAWGKWHLYHPQKTFTRARQFVDRGNTKFDHVFTAKMKSGHIGFYERVPGEWSSNGVQKVRELMGNSGARMLENNDVRERLRQKAVETFNKRFDHEVQYRYMRKMKAKMEKEGRR